MCGIAGFVVDRELGNTSDSLRRMAAAIAHRGPDDEGFFNASTRNNQFAVGLAHRRLSIIDLAGGHQPMSSRDGGVHLVFNEQRKGVKERGKGSEKRKGEKRKGVRAIYWNPRRKHAK